jgi:hypothetical protein
MQKQRLLVHNELYDILPVYYFTTQECQEHKFPSGTIYLSIVPGGIVYHPYIKVSSLTDVKSKWRKRFHKIFSEVVDVVSDECHVDESSFIAFSFFCPELRWQLHPDGSLMLAGYQVHQVLTSMSKITGRKLSMLLCDTREKLPGLLISK